MKQTLATKVWILARLFMVALLCVDMDIAHAADAGENSPGALRAKYDTLRERLALNPFKRPLHLDSSEASSEVAGGIYAVINSPFATVDAALNSPGNWCDILMLHLNTKYCRASAAGQGDVLSVSIGKKYDQPLADAYRVVFAYRVAAQTPNYLQVRLHADQGPLSTSNYHIMLEAIPLENGQTFIHFSYSYAYGLVGRLAMQVYLSTIGRNKVGFTVASVQANGQILHIGGMRGVVERNTMRYYLAIESYLGALSAPPPAQLEKRLQAWFAAIENYPRQLHEMEQDAYLDMKRMEHRRLQAELPVANADRLKVAIP